ncbi:hypothetical protein E2C01_026344 [Portunus trituberculatus]|uniref:Uncharacterized protein n=1 Tax=Portunus trituberculatus TaxID=210409 RepID=A0A5B7EHX0_PORTR|nr:hypothetical protein [Portunus trituberculatus]
MKEQYLVRVSCFVTELVAGLCGTSNSKSLITVRLCHTVFGVVPCTDFPGERSVHHALVVIISSR